MAFAIREIFTFPAFVKKDFFGFWVRGNIMRGIKVVRK